MGLPCSQHHTQSADKAKLVIGTAMWHRGTQFIPDIAQLPINALTNQTSTRLPLRQRTEELHADPTPLACALTGRFCEKGR